VFDMPRKKTPGKVEKDGSDVLIVDRKTNAVVRHSGDLVPEIREWWNKQSLPEIIAEVGTVEAMKALSLGCTVHLLRRLTNPHTPLDVKDRIALTMGPRFTAEIKGRVSDSGPRGASITDLLSGYRID